MIAAASPPDALGRNFGVHRALDTVGATIGPLAAFGLLLFVADGYDAIFVVSFAVAVAGVAVLVLLVPGRRARRRQGPRTVTARGVLRQLASPAVRRPVAAAGLLGLVTIGDGFLYLALQDRDNLAARYFPLLYVGTNIAYLALAVPLGRLADRIGRARVFVGGQLALVAVYLVASGPLSGLGTTVVALALLGTYYAATDGVLPALVSRVAPETGRASAIAAAQTAVVLARFVASLGFGWLWMTIGLQHALWLACGLLLVALPAAGWLLGLHRRGTPARVAP
ncbi:MFS transporter [Luedemannella flava]